MSTSTDVAPQLAAAAEGDTVRVSYPTTDGTFGVMIAVVRDVTVVNGRTYVSIAAPDDLAPTAREGVTGLYTPPANWWRHA